VTVAVSGRGGRRDQAGPAAELWLPDARGEVRLVEDAAPLAAATMPRDIAAGEFQQAVS
jgi:hypothetical protein